MGFPNAMSSILILLIDVVTDVWPAFALGYEKAESDIMNRPPRDREKDRMLDWKLIQFAYIQKGGIQALCLLTCFMLTQMFEFRRFGIGDLYRGSMFVSWSHADYVKETLSGIIEPVFNTITNLPKGVTTAQ